MRQRGVLSLLAAQFFIYEKGGKGGCGLLKGMERSRKNDFEQGRHFTFLPFYLFTLLPFYLLFLYARGVMPERCLKKLVRALWSLKLRWVAISPMVMSE